MFYRRKPQMDHSYGGFGAVAFVHQHKAQHNRKLDDRVTRCDMIGYIDGGKGGFCYEPRLRNDTQISSSAIPL
ncbi:hypothetical protein CROQUDRAFT_656244 [Cronartium quercuum f. sp. fusiforme G11]|uniref:Retroviral polymerase SH3-like domain-containing protein n=1 Tax=Cronartium quercuum f. sp. fusiforme G11 TaxID=708437 RepID=A0A9P6NND6_9BASI|nr:hypothetical protein CROQUDRAFT_656244 [Cronartium quercuum f. sp. fusiforme G11]